MDHERAERHLRLLCDRALRRASGYLDAMAEARTDHARFIRPAPLAAPPSVETVIRDSLASVQDVADALSAVGAIDEELADAILAQLPQALIVRSRTSSGTLAPDVYRAARRHREQAPQTEGGAADLRVAPIGRLVQVPAEGMPSDLYLMAAVVMPGMTALSMIMRTAIQPTRPLTLLSLRSVSPVPSLTALPPLTSTAPPTGCTSPALPDRRSGTASSTFARDRPPG